MNLLRKIYYALSPQMRFLVRRICYFPIDCFDGITGKRDQLTPPKGLIFIGSGDFREQGERLLGILRQYGAVTPQSHILDVGCGIGRLAVPLTRFLDSKGRYDGFDIVKKGIDWCNKHIAPNYPNFHFLHVDLKNDLYNLATEQKASQFIFPYPDNAYDCVVLTSVFTHMLPADVNNYLAQIERVLTPGGKCVATFFLINEAIGQQMKSGKSYFNFSHQHEGYALLDEKVREANIAFDETYLKQMITDNRLHLNGIYYGSWSGTVETSPDFQDLLVLEKPV